MALPAMAILVATQEACQHPNSGTSGGAAVQRDSVYRAHLAKWQRDSAVLDSLTRLVRTDSLYALYRAALGPARASPKLIEAIACEWVRLSRLYGQIPSRRAEMRVLDTVYSDRGIRGSKNADRFFSGLAPDTAFSTDSQSCGKLPPLFPRVVDGTPTDVEPRKPRKP
jgi:hypothetical protein